MDAAGIDYHVMLAANAIQQCLDTPELQPELLCGLAKQTSNPSLQGALSAGQHGTLQGGQSSLANPAGGAASSSSKVKASGKHGKRVRAKIVPHFSC